MYKLPNGNVVEFNISSHTKGDRRATDEDFERHFKDEKQRKEAKELFSTYNELTGDFKG